MKIVKGRSRFWWFKTIVLIFITYFISSDFFCFHPQEGSLLLFPYLVSTLLMWYSILWMYTGFLNAQWVGEKSGLFGLDLGRVKQFMIEAHSIQYTWQWAACAYTIRRVKSSQLLKTGDFPFKVALWVILLAEESSV